MGLVPWDYAFFESFWIKISPTRIDLCGRRPPPRRNTPPASLYTSLSFSACDCDPLVCNKIVKEECCRRKHRELFSDDDERRCPPDDNTGDARGEMASSLAAHRCKFRLCTRLACLAEIEESPLESMELHTYLSRRHLGESGWGSSSSEDASASTQNRPERASLDRPARWSSFPIDDEPIWAPDAEPQSSPWESPPESPDRITVSVASLQQGLSSGRIFWHRYYNLQNIMPKITLGEPPLPLILLKCK
jgi:hypothetical protein